MTIGVLLTCDDGVYDDTIIEVGRTPIGWAEYARSTGCGGGYGSARRIGR
jgi:hypothetical protein